MRTKYRDSFYQGKPTANVINDKQKLIDKVTKLFALADGTNHVEEAETAHKMAVKLLAEHNISLGDIKDDEYVEIVESFSHRGNQYTKFLYNAIADFTGVAFILHDKSFKYIGTRSNIEAFRYMLACVISQRDRDWVATGLSGLSIKVRWMLGYSYGVDDKCKELKKQTFDNIGERELVPVNESRAALAWHRQQGNKVGTSHVETTGYSHRGREAGKNVNLNKGVGSQGAPQQIGA